MDKYAIAVLADDYEAKKRAYEYHAMRNIAGLSAEENSKASQAYQIAKAEMWKAQFDLEQAQMAYATSGKE